MEKRWRIASGFLFDETINNRLRGVSRMDSTGDHPGGAPENIHRKKKKIWQKKKTAIIKSFLKKMSPADVRPEIRGMLKELHKEDISWLLNLPAKIRNSFWRRHNLRMILTLSPMAQILRNQAGSGSVFLKRRGIYVDHTRGMPCGGGCHSGNRCGESRRDANAESVRQKHTKNRLSHG